VPRVIIPLEEAKQYQIDIKIKEEKLAQSSHNSRPSTIRVLIENGLLKQGDSIYLKNALPTYLSYEDNDPVFQAVITGKIGRSDAVRWKKDNAEYSVSALAWKIFKDRHPENKGPGGLNGNWHWVNSEGRPLSEIAEEFWENISQSS